MKKCYLRFRIFLITLTLGLASVFITNGSLQFSDEVPVNLPKVISDSVIEISVADNMLFSSIGAGSGLMNKYGGQGSGISYYASFYGQVVYRESSCHNSRNDTQREFEQRVKDADKMVAFRAFGNNHIKRTKVILETIDEDKWIDIVIYDDKKCLLIISSKNYDAAYEFEKLSEIED